MAHTQAPKFCPECGGRLAPPPRRGNGGPPLACLACGLPVYLDPKLAVACVVETAGGVLLLRRAQADEAHGRWILPGGHVDRGEEVRSAARREVREETGLLVELTRLVGVYSYPGNPVVLLVYLARQTGGRLTGDGESLELRAFPPAALPWDELGYPSTRQALEDFLRGVSPP